VPSFIQSHSVEVISSPGTATDIVTIGIQGPTGIPEDEVTYAKRVDFITDLLLYRGEAVPGTAESASSWRIRKIVIGNDDDVTETWANGDSLFDKIWDNRLSLTYT